MKGNKLKGLFLSLLVVGSLLVSFSPAFANGTESGGNNNTCAAAQDFGTVTLPFVVDGSLDLPDVDFFKVTVTGTPGTLVQIDLKGYDTGTGTPLFDTYLGLFDSGCNLLAVDDESGGNSNSRLVATIPADGIFVLAATSYPDFDFTGAGDNGGTYQLTIAPYLTVGSISGRIIDALTGAPLSGVAEPFAAAYLLRCIDAECLDLTAVSYASADSSGRIRFDTNFSGQPLEVGRYQVAAFADQYFVNFTDHFNVGEGASRDVGDIPLQSFLFRFTDIQPCDNVPAQGGTCSYSVRITNGSGTLLDGATWSNVDSYGVGSLIDYTSFQTASPQQLTLRPGQSKVVKFQFNVPSTVREYASICADAWAGQNRLYPFFNTVGNRILLCIEKNPSGAFSVVPEKKANRLFRQLSGRTLIPPKKK